MDHLKLQMNNQSTAEVSGAVLRTGLGWCSGGAKWGWTLAPGKERETEPGGTMSSLWVEMETALGDSRGVKLLMLTSVYLRG